MNIYVFTHYTFGIGHFMRAARIAEGIAMATPATVFLFSSGAPISGIRLPSGVKYVPLPGEVKPTHTSKQSVSVLAESIANTVIRRTTKCLQQFRKTPPDVLITEFFPFAPARLEKFLVPLLIRVKQLYPSCIIISSVRDIPISDRDVRNATYRRTVPRLLNDLYDLLLVHAERELAYLGAATIEDNVRIPIIYTGYVAAEKTRTKTPPTDILITVGGGRDGAPVIESALTRLRSLCTRLRVTVITGPFLDYRPLAKRFPSCHFVRSSRTVAQQMTRSKLIICMAGYNSVVEAAASGTPCILLPRKGSFEQIYRARIAKRAFGNFCTGLARVPRTLPAFHKLTKSLKCKSTVFRGVQRTVEALRQLHDER